MTSLALFARRGEDDYYDEGGDPVSGILSILMIIGIIYVGFKVLEFLAPGINAILGLGKKPNANKKIPPVANNKKEEPKERWSEYVEANFEFPEKGDFEIRIISKGEKGYEIFNYKDLTAAKSFYSRCTGEKILWYVSAQYDDEEDVPYTWQGYHRKFRRVVQSRCKVLT